MYDSGNKNMTCLIWLDCQIINENSLVRYLCFHALYGILIYELRCGGDQCDSGKYKENKSRHI